MKKFTSVFVVGHKPPETGSFIVYKPLFLYFLFFQCTEKWTPSQKDLVIVSYLGTNPLCLWWELDNIELHVAGVTGWCLRHCCLASRYLSPNNCQRFVSSELLGEIFKQKFYHCRGESVRDSCTASISTQCLPHDSLPNKMWSQTLTITQSENF